MTVENTNSKSGPYDLDGATLRFQRTFFISSSEHLQVLQVIDGVQTEITTGFTNTGIGSDEGETVFTPETYPSGGGVLVLKRNVPNTQETDYSNQARVKPEQVELDLDQVVRQIQDLKEVMNRTLRLSVDRDPSDAELDELTKSAMALSGHVEQIDALAAKLVELLAVYANLAAINLVAPDVANLEKYYQTVLQAATEQQTVFLYEAGKSIYEEDAYGRRFFLAPAGAKIFANGQTRLVMGIDYRITDDGFPEFLREFDAGTLMVVDFMQRWVPSDTQQIILQAKAEADRAFEYAEETKEIVGSVEYLENLVGEAKQAADTAASDANAQIAPNVAAAVNAKNAAQAAADASIQAGQWDQEVDNEAARLALTGLATNWQVYQLDTEHVWRWDGSAWVDRGASPLRRKLDKVLGLRLDSQDAFLQLDDGEFTAFEVDYEGQLRTTALQALKMILKGRMPLTNAEGEIVAAFNQSGNIAANSFGNLGKSWSVSDSIPGWVWALADVEGNIAGGWKDDGSFHAVGLDGDGGEIVSVVDYAFVEPYQDATSGALVTWVAQSPDLRVLEYKPEIGGVWNSVASFRSRPFPDQAGYFLHTAKLTGLAPATAYQFRWPGAAFRDKFLTPPREGVRVCITSDLQQTTFGAGSGADTMGLLFSAEDCHLAIWNGDYVDDDGRHSASFALRWRSFMERIAFRWRSNGYLVPHAFTIGNHEAWSPTTNASALGFADGVPGYIHEICSLGYDPEMPEFTGLSRWSFSVGREVGFIAYDTAHCQTIDSQLGWLTAEFEKMAPVVRHLNLVGHSPAFFSSSQTWERGAGYLEQSPKIKRYIWPLMSTYADKMRAYWVGHEHTISVTDKLRMVWDDNLSVADNYDRWVTDPVTGVRQLGAGTMGSSAGGWAEAERERPSVIDGSPKMIAAAVLSGGVLVTYGDIAGAGRTNMHNFWVADYSSEEFIARCVGTGQHVFYEIEETI